MNLLCRWPTAGPDPSALLPDRIHLLCRWPAAGLDPSAAVGLLPDRIHLLPLLLLPFLVGNGDPRGDHHSPRGTGTGGKICPP
ncbi:hypothetical protein SLEP1_g34248 [Rubroshorea leprosula]|uniref:Uncharacterized protein n=1 Tax=Rubroshorea leprosula TaxID=152421 RepID=A0AAV5KJB5_9ROSI|nr:hypothetical protein SLEP1_g34248 [Rubroshorea leprosula]